MKIAHYEEVNEGDLVVKATVSHYKYKIAVLVYNYFDEAGPFRAYYKLEASTVANRKKRISELQVWYSEEEYRTLKEKNNYKETYLEHVILLAARNLYNFIKEK